ncbi:MAG: ASPIC/UnbV domain-containing protein, partial [Bacteroidota bacterium]
IDQDGSWDMAIANFAGGEGNQLFHNVGNDHHWIAFELEGTESNRSAVGARVRIAYGDGQQQIDQIVAGSGFASQNASPLHFGLGAVEQVDLVQVFWPSGTIETFRDLAVDQRHPLTENTTQLSSQQGAALLNAYPNPFSGQLHTQVQVSQSGLLQLSLYGVDGRLLQQSKEQVDAGNISHHWQTDFLPAGMYLIEMQFAGQRISQKLIKLL